MSCIPIPPRSRPGVLVQGILLASTSCATAARRFGVASQYRVPAVILAYPDRGAPLPADRPIVLFRFAPREADDPIDATSFRATVDGMDRTGQFRVASSEASGALGDTTTAAPR